MGAQYKIIMSYFNKNDLRGTYQQFMAFKNNFPADERYPPALRHAPERLSGTVGHKRHSCSAELSDLLRACPGAGTGASILWERGAALFNKKDYAAAQKYFQRIMVSYPGEDFASQAFYYNAECYFLTCKNGTKPLPPTRATTSNYPNDKMVAQAMFQSGRQLPSAKKIIRKRRKGLTTSCSVHTLQNSLAKDAALNVALCYKKGVPLG